MGPIQTTNGPQTTNFHQWWEGEKNRFSSPWPPQTGQVLTYTKVSAFSCDTTLVKVGFGENRDGNGMTSENVIKIHKSKFTRQNDSFSSSSSTFSSPSSSKFTHHHHHHHQNSLFKIHSSSQPPHNLHNLHILSPKCHQRMDSTQASRTRSRIEGYVFTTVRGAPKTSGPPFVQGQNRWMDSTDTLKKGRWL